MPIEAPRLVSFRTPVCANPPRPGSRPEAGWRSLPRCCPLSDDPSSLPGHRCRAPTRHPLPHTRTPKGDALRLTRFARDEAHPLLFKEQAAGRPGTPSVVSRCSVHLCTALCPLVFPRAGSTRGHHTHFTLESTTGRINELDDVTLARPSFREHSSRSAHRSADRHVRSTSAAHVILFSKTSTHVSRGYRLHSRSRRTDSSPMDHPHSRLGSPLRRTRGCGRGLVSP